MASVGTLTITSPVNGTTVSTSTVTVRGTAPVNAEVIHDIPSLPDQRTLADPQGNWSLDVKLDKGQNVLVFRLANDVSHQTEQRILVTVTP